MTEKESPTPKKILVVDDSPLTRRQIRKHLENDYCLIEAQEGEEALRLIATTKFDCILLDLLMPGMDGFAFLRRFRSQDTSTPVIVLTADVQTTTHEACREAGANRILSKPPSPKEVKETIQDVLSPSP